ncbi:MAG: type II toxin-antitoxin system VapC family toxin [Planctomycetota bacterium]
MKLLLDTCTFLWLVLDESRLSAAARESFQDPANDTYLSAVSVWEISLKHAAGKLPLPESVDRFVPRVRGLLDVEPLPLDEESALHLARLPAIHGDPFDRMLISQALMGGMVLVTPDQVITQYPVRTLW